MQDLVVGLEGGLRLFERDRVVRFGHAREARAPVRVVQADAAAGAVVEEIFEGAEDRVGLDEQRVEEARERGRVDLGVEADAVDAALGEASRQLGRAPGRDRDFGAREREGAVLDLERERTAAADLAAQHPPGAVEQLAPHGLPGGVERPALQRALELDQRRAGILRGPADAERVRGCVSIHERGTPRWPRPLRPCHREAHRPPASPS